MMMTTTRDVYSGNTLSAADLRGPVTVTIANYEVKTFQEGNKSKRKLVLYFERAQKAMVINKTNAGTIEFELGYGGDVDNWIGKKITIFPTMVDFGGKKVPGLRIRAPESGNGSLPTKTQESINQIVAKQEAAKRSLDPLEALDDEIPF